MQGKYLIHILLFVSLVSSVKLFSQNDSANNNSYYFDDEISEGKNIVKLNVLSIISGDVPLYYERIFSKSFSFEIGVGLLMPYYFEYPVMKEKDEIKNFDFGYSLWIHPKYYIQRRAPEYNYVGIQLRKRNFKLEDKEYKFTDVSINFGLQLFVSKKKNFIFDYNVGVGVRFKKQEPIDINEKDGIHGVVLPIGVRLGYIF